LSIWTHLFPQQGFFASTYRNKARLLTNAASATMIASATVIVSIKQILLYFLKLILTLKQFCLPYPINTLLNETFIYLKT